LCQLWKSIVLNDQERMQYFSKQLGVDGKDYRSLCVCYLFEVHAMEKRNCRIHVRRARLQKSFTLLT